MMRPTRIEPGPGQESVWDYPRPPRLERSSRQVQVIFNGVVIADSTRALRLLETSHPPVYYFPPEDVRLEHFEEAPGCSFCEWKGAATYYTIQVGGRSAEKAAWCYRQPVSAYAGLKDHLAFYPSLMDACLVDGEKAEAQPGDFYGGWITKQIVGPFKGGTGTLGW